MELFTHDNVILLYQQVSSVTLVGRTVDHDGALKEFTINRVGCNFVHNPPKVSEAEYAALAALVEHTWSNPHSIGV